MGPAAVNNGQQQEQPRFGQQSGKFSLDAMLQDKFNQLDLDGNGVLEVPELKSVAQWFWSQSHQGEKPTSQQAERQLNKLSMRFVRLLQTLIFSASLSLPPCLYLYPLASLSLPLSTSLPLPKISHAHSLILSTSTP